MKQLLTSGGISNATIKQALIDLLGKPISQANALCIPTAAYGHPEVKPDGVWRFISGHSSAPMVDLGWQSVGVLELTALPTIATDRWHQWIADTDVLLVDGGDAVYLNYWLHRSGLADLLPDLPDKLWVGVSAGSMVMAPRIGQFFVNWKASTNTDDTTLGLVNFGIFPHWHLFPENNLANAQKWVKSIGIPGYLIDEQTAIQVVDHQTTVISEVQWQLLKP